MTSQQTNNQLVLPYLSGDITPNGKLLINFQVIQRWANNFAVGGGTYKSLTGPGQTATPGKLTQQGGFSVQDTAGGGDGIVFNTSASIDLNAGDEIDVDAGTIQVVASGNLNLNGETSTTIGGPNIDIGAVIDVVTAPADTGTIGFFAATPVHQQPIPSTLAQVIAGLQALGLFAT